MAAPPVRDPEPRSPAEADGRRARRDQNRDAVVEAVLTLWREGDLSPEVASIAERSGVSERSIFRYFDDVASLQRAVIARQLERETGLFDRPATNGTLDERVARFVELRLRQFDVLGPVARVAFLRAPFEEVVRGEITRRRDQIRAQVLQLFEAELRPFDRAARAEVIAAIEVATSFEALEFLRSTRGMTGARAGRVLARSVRAQLTAAP
jgi:AcrR family transcriptional regulator